MKKTWFLWLIWVIFIVVVAALVATGWFYAQCDLREWANIFLNLIITVIGAFLGFVTALWLDRYNENRKTIETKNNYLKSLSRDINKIKDSLNTIMQKDIDGVIIFQSLQGISFYFELPIWEAMVSSGEVNLFNEETFFDDICELAAKIKTLNNIENNLMIARLVNTKISIDTITEEKLREIYNLCEKIDSVLVELINDKR